MQVRALHHIRALRGRTNPHLISCEDEELYVVKMAWNRLGERVLVYDYVGTRLAELIGLPVPTCRVVSVDRFLVKGTQDILDERPAIAAWRKNHPSKENDLHFGSRLVSRRPWNVPPLDPSCGIPAFGHFAGALALDLLCANSGSRQAVFFKPHPYGSYAVNFIDYSRAFSGFCEGEWTGPASSLFRCPQVYEAVNGWDSFEPYLSKLASVAPDALWAICRGAPSPWYERSPFLVELMVDGLLQRRAKIAGLISKLRADLPGLFPAWRAVVNCRLEHDISTARIGPAWGLG